MIIFMEIMVITIIALVLEERMTKNGKSTRAQWFKRMATIGGIVVLITIGVSFVQNIDAVIAGFREGYSNYDGF